MTEPRPEGDAAATLARRMRVQGRACGDLGSTMYADLMERAAVDIERGGVFLDAFAGHEDDPGPNAIALRLFGAVHRFALAGEAPGVAAHYPSAGGDGEVDAAWEALRDFVGVHTDRLRPFLDQPPQTNEVGRSAALTPAFPTVAERWPGRPLRLLEVGASGGLNLRWDHYRYEVGGGGWGDERSPLVFPPDWFENPWPRWPARGEVTVSERRGCDIAPIDVTTEDGRLTLLSYVWPDQEERFARLHAALDVARNVPASVERADASGWLDERLAEAAVGRVTVVYHSIFVQYLTAAGRSELRGRIEAAGERATRDAPLAWVRMEPVPHGRSADVRVTSWPGGEERVVATASFHGRPVRVV